MIYFPGYSLQGEVLSCMHKCPGACVCARVQASVLAIVQEWVHACMHGGMGDREWVIKTL